MKKNVTLLFILYAALFLIGCVPAKPPYSFDAAQIQSIDVYTGLETSEPSKKEVTSAGDLERLTALLNGVRIRGQGVPADETAGRGGIFFLIQGQDGEIQIIQIGGNGVSLTCDGFSYEIGRIDYPEIWESLDYERQEAQVETHFRAVVTKLTDSSLWVKPDEAIPGWNYSDEIEIHTDTLSEEASLEALRELETGDTIAVGCLTAFTGTAGGQLVSPLDSVYELRRVTFPSLSLEQVIELSEKGNALTWEDFAPYRHEDIGSGLYILLYDIDDHFYLLVGGKHTGEPPDYIRLVNAKDRESYIDIRTENVRKWTEEELERGTAEG